MRLLHVIHSLDPAYGGTTEAVRLLVNFAPPSLHSEIVTLDDADAPFLDGYRCPVHALGKSSGMAVARRLTPWLRQHAAAYDAAVVHGLWNFAAHATRRALAGRIPFAVFPHGMLDPYFKRRFPLKHIKKLPYWWLTEAWTLRAAHRVLFTTAVEARLARQSFSFSSWKEAVVPLGAAPLEPASFADREAFFELCPDARGRRLLLFLGRLHPKKGIDMLVQAFLRVAAQEPALDLVVAGPCDAEHTAWVDALRVQIAAAGLAGRVHWPGMVQGPCKRGAFDVCEAFILPSHQENFGIAVVEALAAGRPVLLSDQINIAPEIAADGAGLMAADTPEGALALCTEWLALSEEARRRMADAALATFRRRYDMHRNAALLESLFREA
jgi:glycosyltransferase involved in cell wall biosynthesis